MKRFGMILLALLLMLQYSFSAALADSRFTVNLDIEFHANLIFSRYDVDVYVNQQKLNTLPHGTNYSTSFQAEKGNYSIVLYKTDNKGVTGKFNFDVKGDTDISCEISCHRGNISIEKISIKSRENQVAVQTSPPPVVNTPEAATEIGNEMPIVPTDLPVESTKPISRDLNQLLSTESGSAATSWMLSYNRLSEISELLTLHLKDGENIRLVAHRLPSGKYHVKNSKHGPARISFYRDVQNLNGIDNLIPGREKDIILFANEETDFQLSENEFIKISDGGTELYFEATDL